MKERAIGPVQKKKLTTPTAPQKLTGVIATIVALAVMLVTGFVLSPVGTPLRSEVRTMALPHFTQTWKVFAPNIMKADRTLEFRVGWIDENADIVKSDWVDATQIEQRNSEGNPFPSRVQKLTWNVSGTYMTRYRALDDEQRARVKDTFIERDGDGYAAIPDAQLISELGEDDGDVIRYLRMDYMVMRHLTLLATAGFDKKIERLQWRVVTHRPNDFTHRFDEEDQYGVYTTTFGWRQSTLVIDPTIVDDYRALVERVGAEHEFEEAASEAE